MQVIGNHVVEFLLSVRRNEFLRMGFAVSVRDVFEDLATKRALANHIQTRFKVVKIVTRSQTSELGFEAGEVTECVFVNKADEAVKFKQRVLQRSRGEQEFRGGLQRIANGIGDLVLWFVDVAKSMGFVDHDQIPWNVAHVLGFVASEWVRAKYDLVTIEWIGDALLDLFVEGGRFKNLGRQIELVHQFLIPLLTKTRRQDD